MSHRLILALLMGGFLVRPAAATGLSVGMVGGPVRTDFSGDKPPRGSYRSGFGHQLGLSIDVDLTPHVVLAVQPSLLQQSVDLRIKTPTLEDPNAREVFGIGLESVTVPLMAQYVFGTNNVRFVIETGLELRFLRDARIEQPGGSRTDITGEIAETETAFDLGLGVRFSTGLVRWSVETRVVTGLSDLTEGDPLDGAAGEDIVWKSRSTQLLASATVPVF